MVAAPRSELVLQPELHNADRTRQSGRTSGCSGRGRIMRRSQLSALTPRRRSIRCVVRNERPTSARATDRGGPRYAFRTSVRRAIADVRTPPGLPVVRACPETSSNWSTRCAPVTGRERAVEPCRRAALHRGPEDNRQTPSPREHPQGRDVELLRFGARDKVEMGVGEKLHGPCRGRTTPWGWPWIEQDAAGCNPSELRLADGVAMGRALARGHV